MSLAGLKTAVIGGDARELEIVRLMKLEGMDVKVIGLPPAVEAVLGRPQEKTVGDAIDGCQALVLPIPGQALDEAIFAPAWPERIYVRPADLARAVKPACMVMGWASPTLKGDLEHAGIRLREYEKDDELMILRSRAIAEGAIKIIIENTDVTIHKAKVFLLGFGRVAMTMLEVLNALGARVTLVARNPAQLARGWEMGAEPLELTQLAGSIGQARIVINTVPVRLLDAGMIKLTAPDVLLIDMSAPPGGIDFDAAKALGRKGVWARGLGSRAPVTVGGSQWKGVRKILVEELRPQN